MHSTPKKKEFLKLSNTDKIYQKGSLFLLPASDVTAVHLGPLPGGLLRFSQHHLQPTAANVLEPIL
jgi:hypothetical protein